MPLFSLRTGGGLALLKNGEVVGGPSAQRKRLILLALVAAHGQGAGVARERVLGLLWPESDEARARNALNQLLFGLRRDLGGDVITGSNDLRLDSAAMDCDIAEVWAAQTRDDMRGVVANYHGPFLDGVYLSGAGDLNAWIDRTRTSVDDVYRAALARLARDADTEHSTAAAVALWRRLAAAAPLDAAVACSLMRALVANGDRTGALAHARVYGALIRSELEIEPDPSVIVLASEVAALSASSVAATSTPREVINTLPVPPDVRLRSDSSASVEIHLVGASGAAR